MIHHKGHEGSQMKPFSIPLCYFVPFVVEKI